MNIYAAARFLACALEIKVRLIFEVFLLELGTRWEVCINRLC